MRNHSTGIEVRLDVDQDRVAVLLDRLVVDLRRRDSGRLRRRRRTVEGLYVWGAPGRGKTMLVDRFTAALGAIAHSRWHFHDFVDLLQVRITAHARHPGAIDRAFGDLLTVGGVDLRVLVFDEFHVHDSGTATLLIRLLREVSARGITLVATSNSAPRDLLPDPVFREVFEPGVAALRRLTRTVELAGDHDYRRSDLQSAGGFVCGRVFGAESFADVCGRPRSARDYLHAIDERALREGWRIENIPLLDRCPLDHAVRFTHLVDVAFDRGVPLWLSTPHPVADLIASCTNVPGGTRLQSRLSALPQVANSRV